MQGGGIACDNFARIVVARNCQSSAVAVVSEVKGMPLTATETHEMHRGRRCVIRIDFTSRGASYALDREISPGKAYAARNFPVA